MSAEAIPAFDPAPLAAWRPPGPAVLPRPAIARGGLSANTLFDRVPALVPGAPSPRLTVER